MSLGRLLRRASSRASDLLTLAPGGGGPPSILDGEILYSKNNVCVHPPEGLQGLGEHHPGYLCLYMEKDELLGATLILAWVPNSRIQRQDEEALRYITPEGSPVRKAPRPRARRTQSAGAPCRASPTEPRPPPAPRDEDILLSAEGVSRDSSFDSDSDAFSSPCCLSPVSAALVDSSGSVFLEGESGGHPASPLATLDGSPLGAHQTWGHRDPVSRAAEEQGCLAAPPWEGPARSQAWDEGEDQAAYPFTRASVSLPLFPSSGRERRRSQGSWPGPPTSGRTEGGARDGSPSSVDAHLRFPDSDGLQTPRGDEPQRARALEQICGVFRVDLGHMRSLRLFFSDEACTSGQLVVASRESQYKVLHFHHGGLDKLASALQQWERCAGTRLHGQQVADEKTCMKFSIRRPKLPSSETHPEESTQATKTRPGTWGRSEPPRVGPSPTPPLPQAIFFGGIDVSIRGEVWPFLLRYYRPESTSEEREALRAQKRQEYAEIEQRRLSMTPEEHREFWRNVQFTVDKDVVRTDRSSQFFRGEGNPNVESMRRILLNYAVYSPAIGYSQGMSDLVAPLLAEVLDESDTFWCFVGLMQNTIFVSSPRDEDMERQLLYLRELLRLTHPRFYQHLAALGEDGLQLLFCHRWLLLCFKREFPAAEALRIWEACWAHYQTDYFHLFICVAIVAIYGDDVIEQQLATDQMLLHFGNLAMHMNGELVLRKARSLLYQFRLRPRIPCSLHDLCKLCGSGMWDSGYMPAVECTGHHPGSRLQRPPGRSMRVPWELMEPFGLRRRGLSSGAGGAGPGREEP
ncbi:hypothetical protein QTO34_008696 [Cnephaeus nilssonii]|uniref:Rab-GAP TBC domain-containing protein n=1 Tax=Cnephaeus nilssonii TaxID=3371016 RepID=A0AA40HGL0_CNENI|nr:hypothetical protein QTO34_008696 [Eptesicus nilssonii]